MELADDQGPDFFDLMGVDPFPEMTPEERAAMHAGLDVPQVRRNGVEMAQAWQKGGMEGLRQKMKDLFPEQVAKEAEAAKKS